MKAELAAGSAWACLVLRRGYFFPGAAEDIEIT